MLRAGNLCFTAASRHRIRILQQETISGSFKGKGESSYIKKGGNHLLGLLSSPANIFSIWEIVKKEKEMCVSFAVTFQAAKETITKCDNGTVKT